ncbi:hypothetical protein [Pasteurella multocida]|uniref:hypothetical protein n=1 Tax=Pasteurella multocida TaxID=747 RepID=UPI000CF2FE8F|nr:hypothetical protein [Pasteurella multocida]
MTNLTIEQSQNAVALAAKQMTQDMAEAYEVMGTLKAFNFVQKLLTVGSLKKLQEIKETKKYKGLSFVDDIGKKIYEDLQNLNTFGEEFLETEDARAEIVEADYSETADKEDLIEKIEELTVKHAKEKESLEAQLKTAKDNYTAQARVLDNKNKRIDQLDAELEKKKQYINTLTPDEKGGVLRKETSQLVYGAEAILRGQVWKAFETLDAHAQESGIDHKQFMTGVLAEIELVINELRTTFNLPQFADGDNTPAWARGNETPDYSDAFNAIINGEEQE